MLRIVCPVCGPRAEVEFRFGGESFVQRPPLDCSDEVWAAYLYERSNPKGLLAERWLHVHGCGLWFNLLRSTATHEIKASWGMAEPMPEAPE